MEERFDVPVVFIVYKRLDVTIRSFEAIRRLKPEKLYVVCDGPRNEQEMPAVSEVRNYIDNNVDWDCELYRDYAERNMGLRYRMPSGMEWVFSREECAIFVEDDIEATQDFFLFCREMLNKYRDDEHIAMISGTNLYPEADVYGEEDVVFTAFATIWGWASWRRAWELYDVNIHRWPELRRRKSLKKILNDRVYDFFEIVFDDLQYHWYRTWGYQWDFLLWANECVGIVPRYNLVNNIGMGDARGEHPGDSSEKVKEISTVPLSKIDFPLRCPEKIERNKEYDKLFQERFFTEKISLTKKIKYKLRAALYSRAHDVIKAMEKDDEYFLSHIPEECRFSEGEVRLNKGDRYHELSPRRMCKDAREYKKYLRNGKI